MSKAPIHVCISAFDKDQCYTDDPDMMVGWTVYARSDPEEEDFEVFDEADFTSYENAVTHANTLSVRYGITDLREF